MRLLIGNYHSLKYPIDDKVDARIGLNKYSIDMGEVDSMGFNQVPEWSIPSTWYDSAIYLPGFNDRIEVTVCGEFKANPKLKGLHASVFLMAEPVNGKLGVALTLYNAECLEQSGHEIKFKANVLEKHGHGSLWLWRDGNV